MKIGVKTSPKGGEKEGKANRFASHIGPTG